MVKYGVQKINYNEKIVYLKRSEKGLEVALIVPCTKKEDIEAHLAFARERESIVAIERRDNEGNLLNFKSVDYENN